jgi:hypothetical protein
MCDPTPQVHHGVMTNSSTIAIRAANADDSSVLRELSELDSARPVSQPAVVALVDGRPVAAASLSDGRVVADPFTETADVVALLQARVSAFAPARARRRRPRLHLPRLRAA